MADAELGLKLAFYLYPCLVFATLLGSQTLQYYLNRRRDSRRNASEEQKQKTDSIRRSHSHLIWFIQLLLSVLLLVSIILAVREALASRHDAVDTIEFSFSAYLVHTESLSLQGSAIANGGLGILCRSLALLPSWLTT